MDPWAAVEQHFRTTYDAAVERKVLHWPAVLEARSGRRLALVTQGATHIAEWPEPETARRLRTLSHLPLLLYLTVCESGTDRHGTAQHYAAISATIDEADLTVDQSSRNRGMLDRGNELLGRADALTCDDVIEHVRSCRAVIDANLADAARLNLATLRSAVVTLLGRLDADQLENLVVLNRGNKSARVGNQVELLMRAVLGDAAADERLVFAEGAEHDDEAREVLGAYLVDRAIGAAFFEDPMTMRSDVLSSPTQEAIDAMVARGDVPSMRPQRASPDSV